MSLVYTLDQVADLLQVKASWIRARCEGREVPFTMLSGSYRFTPEHVEQIIALYEEKPAGRRRPTPRPATPSNVVSLEPKTPARLRKKHKQTS